MTGDRVAPHELSAGTRQSEPRIAVLLSERLARVGAGLDLDLLQTWVGSTLRDAQAHVVPGLAVEPGQVVERITISGARGLVLGLPSGEYATGAVQAEARKAGLDPLSIVVLNLGAQAALLCGQPIATERAKLLIAAAVAKACAFPGSRPENLKVSLSVAMSRRALLTLSVREHRAVPAVLTERCSADQGCRSCITACPQAALSVANQRLNLDKERCAGCGLCVSACPDEALTFPGHSFAEIDAQVAALLAPGLAELTPRGILFVCPQSAAELDSAVNRSFRYPPGWLPVPVPCAGSISLSQLVHCLALGASGVGIAACAEPCPFGQKTNLSERVALCQDLLRGIGADPERVKTCRVGDADPSAWALPESDGAPPMIPLAGTSSRSPRTAAAALMHLAQTHGGHDDLALEHPQSPFGVVEIDAPGCTVCEACASVCPTGALAGDSQNSEMTITFDAALCVACGRCVTRCPEAAHGVLHLRRALDLRRLAAGRTVVSRAEARFCQRCGAPIAPAALLARVAALLGGYYGPLEATLAGLCGDCRGWPAGPSRNGEIG